MDANSGSSLQARIRDDLRERISRGQLGLGARLIERDLAERFGVSRVPVREALRSLEAEGLVEIQKGRGAMVRTLSLAEVEDIFDVRETLEGTASRRAAERRSESGLALMREALDAAAAHIAAGDLPAADDMHVAFHDLIVVEAHSATLRRVIDSVTGRLTWLLRQNQDHRGMMLEHEAIYNAIAAGDASAADDLAQAHVRSGRATVVSAMFGR